MSYRLDWVHLVCPQCHAELDARPATEAEVDQTLVCQGCDRTFPVILGIPDLRIFPDPYISMEGDRIKGSMLAARFDRENLEGIIRTYYHVTPETPAADVERNLTRLLNADRRAAATLAAWDALFGAVEGDSVVDVGCGTAPLLLALRSRFNRVVGVDVSFRWLVVAKRRLADAGVSLPLVAACGEALPFPAGTLNAVTMESYLEITKDPRVALTEARRVMKAAGRLLITTPNRFSVGPDPHIGMPGGGFLPSPVVNAIARQRMARPPLRHLYSARRLRAELVRSGLADVRVELPGVSNAQLATIGPLGRKAAEWYNRLRGVGVAREVLLAIGPMLSAEARKA